MDIMKMMKQAKEMQSKMTDMQEEISSIEVEGNSGGDLVKVILSGKGEMRGLTIDPSLFTEHDKEILEDLIMAAHNDAKSKSEAVMAEKMKDITGGLNLPAGMKLPF
ncbi:MAG: YbaB/EbfC family nucleoid-associated protein [Hyphomicrobiales bacterium]|nr:MAG: YbaB/EbfC family nucleoid-associated protein [Hyphomicrobiales bacterium]